jgi:hypothetical protein
MLTAVYARFVEQPYIHRRGEHVTIGHNVTRTEVSTAAAPDLT